MDTTGKHGRGDKTLFTYSVRLLKATFRHWLEDKAPQLGAALAYYTVFSLAKFLQACCWHPTLRMLSKRLAPRRRAKNALGLV